MKAPTYTIENNKKRHSPKKALTKIGKKKGGGGGRGVEN